MKTLTFRADFGQDSYHIDAAVLNNELAAALGGWCNGWSARHNAHEAIVDFEDESKADLITQVVNAHIANTAKREHNKGIEAQIVKLEATVTQRMLRDAALGDNARIAAIETQIAALRGQRQ